MRRRRGSLAKNVQVEWKRIDLVISIVLLFAALLITVSSGENIPMGNASSVPGELTIERPLSQELPINGRTIEQIDLMVGTYARENTSEIQLRLVDNNGKVYAEKIFTCENLIDNAAYSWKFPPISFPKDVSVRIEVHGKGNAGNAVTLYYDASLPGEIIVGDTIFYGQLAGTLYDKTTLRTVFSYGIEPAKAIFLIVFVWICLFFISQKKELILVTRCLFAVTPCVLVIFFAMPPVLTYDSAHYLHYLPILNGIRGFEKWDIVRGPVFPYILNFTCKFFGKNCEGLLTLEFLFFEATLFCLLTAIHMFSLKRDKTYAIMVFAALIFVLNPLISGGYHAVLTEFPAALLALQSCLISWKFARRDGPLDKFDAIYVLYFVIFSVIGFQLKQPYAGCVVYPVLSVALYTCVLRIRQNKRRIAVRIAVPFLCIFASFLSMTAWTNFIDGFGSMNETRTSQSIMSRMILSGLPLKQSGIYNSGEIAENFSLSEAQVNYIDKQSPDTQYNVFQLNTIRYGTQPKIVFVSANQRRTIANISVFLQCFIQFPQETMENIGLRYLKICDIVRPTVSTNQPSLDLQAGHGDENATIYYRMLYQDSNVFPIVPFWADLQDAADPFYYQDKLPTVLLSVLKLNAIFYTDSAFKVLMFFTPAIWVFLFVMMIRNRKHLYRHNELLFHFILWTYCFCNLMFNVLFSGPIDRYIFTNFVLAFVSTALLLVKGWRFFMRNRRE